MDINDDIANMPIGWIVQYNDGKILTEYLPDGTQCNWRKIPKKGIRSLSLKWHNKFWTIYGKDNYLQKKRGWVSPTPGVDMEPTIQFRFIGFWDGNDKLYYQVDERTGQMKIIVEDGK